MCGIVGVFGHQPVGQVIYDSLSMLQHRGQDAAGIATSFEDRFYLHKGNGLITDVFDAGNMAKLLGNAELRWRFLSIGDFEIGTVAALDVGRVWARLGTSDVGLSPEQTFFLEFGETF